MKILCDVHISYKIVDFFNNKGIEAVHVNNILDKWHTTDQDICKYANENNYVVVSKDVDFRNSYFLQKTPKKLIRVNLGNITNSELIKIFNNNLALFEKIFDKERFYIEINKENIFVSS
ncbi:MAG: DUF5615 family PIN-like protein [Bacteroidota bacterium]